MSTQKSPAPPPERRRTGNTLTLAVSGLVALGAAAYLTVALVGGEPQGSGPRRTYVEHPLPPGVRADDVRRLGRGAYTYGDFFAGIVSTSGDAPGEPWVRLALNDSGTHQDDVVEVRAGQTVHVGRYTIRFIDVVPGDDRHVTFTLDGPRPAPAPSPSPTASPTPSPTASPSYADDWPH